MGEPLRIDGGSVQRDEKDGGGEVTNRRSQSATISLLIVAALIAGFLAVISIAKRIYESATQEIARVTSPDGNYDALVSAYRPGGILCEQFYLHIDRAGIPVGDSPAFYWTARDASNIRVRWKTVDTLEIHYVEAYDVSYTPNVQMKEPVPRKIHISLVKEHGY